MGNELDPDVQGSRLFIKSTKEYDDTFLFLIKYMWPEWVHFQLVFYNIKLQFTARAEENVIPSLLHFLDRLDCVYMDTNYSETCVK